MSNPKKTLERLLSGQADASISFADQPKGSQAKPYQVRQVRDVVLKYKLSLDKNV